VELTLTPLHSIHRQRWAMLPAILAVVPRAVMKTEVSLVYAYGQSVGFCVLIVTSFGCVGRSLREKAWMRLI
jgi:hypothetical protein